MATRYYVGSVEIRPVDSTMAYMPVKVARASSEEVYSRKSNIGLV